MEGLLLLYLVFIVLLLASFWKIYSKAGQPGWACIVPIYNLIVLLEVVKKPIWWILLLMVPVVNVVVNIILLHRLSVAYGKGGGFTAGLILLPFVFIPILGLGSAQYDANRLD
jgi:hypothetical protein